MRKYQVKTEGFVHRKVSGTDVLISVGKNIANYNGYIEMKPAAAFLWDAMKTEKTIEELKEEMVKVFKVDSETAQADIKDFLRNLEENEMVKISE